MEDPKVQALGTENGAAGAPAKETPATDADWKAERLRAQRIAKAALAENEKLKGQLAEIENAKKTEQEKAIEKAVKDARDAALAEVAGATLTKEIRSEIRIMLAKAGVPENQVAVIIDESKPETIEDAKTITAAYAEKWKTDYARPSAAGMGGGPLPMLAGGNRPWTQEKVNAFVLQHGHAELLKHEAEIVADMNAG